MQFILPGRKNLQQSLHDSFCEQKLIRKQAALLLWCRYTTRSTPRSDRWEHPRANIVATGGGADSNIRAVGPTIAADNTVNLAADNAIRLEASQNTWEQHGSNKSSSTSIGVGYAAGAQNGFTIELGVSQGKGKEGGNITGEGMKIRGDDGVLVQAGGVLDLHEARDVRSQSREVSVKKSGFGIGAIGPPLPDKKASRDTTSTYSNTATVTIIESTNGGMPLQGDQRVALQGVQVMRPRT